MRRSAPSRSQGTNGPEPRQQLPASKIASKLSETKLEAGSVKEHQEEAPGRTGTPPEEARREHERLQRPQHPLSNSCDARIAIARELAALRESNELKLPEMLYRSDHDLLSETPAKASRLPLGKDYDRYSTGRRVGTSFVAIDCEMVGVGHRGRTAALARVSIVNKWGYPLLDIFVNPTATITDWRTRWSGINATVFRQARLQGKLFSFADARRMVEETINGRTIVGHSIKNDLAVLQLDSLPAHIVDTQKSDGYQFFGVDKQPGLKNAMNKMFGITIQNQGKAGHSSVEDAQATMLLYRVLRPEYYKTASRQPAEAKAAETSL